MFEKCQLSQIDKMCDEVWLFCSFTTSGKKDNYIRLRAGKIVIATFAYSGKESGVKGCLFKFWDSDGKVCLSHVFLSARQLCGSRALPSLSRYVEYH